MVVVDIVMDSKQLRGEAKSTRAAVKRIVKDESAMQSDDEQPPEDIVILYHTLVQDGVIPAGYEQEFSTLAGAKAFAPAAARTQQDNSFRKRGSSCLA